MKKSWIKGAAALLFLVGVLLCAGFVNVEINYTIQEDGSNLEELALQFLQRGAVKPEGEVVRIYDSVSLGNRKYVLMEYIQSDEPKLGRIYLEKGMNGKYKIDSIGYGGGNFRESVEESGGKKYLVFGGRNTYFGIAGIKAVLDGREYVLVVPEGDHFLVYTEVDPTIYDTHCDWDQIVFYGASGRDITDQVIKSSNSERSVQIG